MLHFALYALATALVCLPAPAAAADFLAGQTIDTYKYYYNVSTYANITMDLRDMLSWVDAGNYGEAQKIYLYGKNAFRNLETKTTRIAQPVVARNYTTAAGFVEPWWLIAVTYYPDIVAAGVVNPNAYLDKWITDALVGAGDFAPNGQFVSYRADMLKAFLTFYPILYYSHEVDAGYTSLMANPAATKNGHTETDDAVACYTGVSPASTETNTVRAAPGFTPWEVSEKLATFFCTTGTFKRGQEKVTTSSVNVDFLKLSKDIQNLFVGTGTLVPTLQPSNLLVLRNKQLKNLNINQIQLTLKAVYEAANGKLCTNVNKPCMAAKLAGEAFAHWRLAQPALNFLGVPKGQLQAIESLLNPNVWRAAAAEDNSLQKLLKQAVKAIKESSLQAGYLWNSQIANCKLNNGDISALSVGAAEPAAADAILVEAAAMPVLTAASVVDNGPVSPAAGGVEPVAAAMAALAAIPPNPEGVIVDPASLSVDADPLN